MAAGQHLIWYQILLLPLNSASSLISSQNISTYQVALRDSNADQIRGLRRQLLEMKL